MPSPNATTPDHETPQPEQRLQTHSFIEKERGDEFYRLNEWLILTGKTVLNVDAVAREIGSAVGDCSMCGCVR